MAKASRSGRMNFPRSLNTRDRNPADPLRRARHEAFAKAFALKPDAKAAAVDAGYPRHRASRAAVRLLSVPMMTARIQHLQIRDAEALTITKLVQELYFKPKVALAKAMTQNPFTGETRLDLGRLTPLEVASLEFSVSVGDGPSHTGSALKVQSGSGKGLAALGRLVSDPAYAPERRQKESLSGLLAEIAQRNVSAAPIRSQRERKHDPNDPPP